MKKWLIIASLFGVFAVCAIVFSQTATIDDLTEHTDCAGADYVMTWDSDAAVNTRTKKCLISNVSKGIDLDNVTTGEIGAAQIATDAIGTAELDLTISPAWTGDHDFGAGGIEIENNTAVPGSCTAGQIFLDTDATSGQQFYACEAGTFVLQGDGTGGDSVSIDGVGVVDPDFVSTGDIDFVDTSNTVTANINASSIVVSDVANGDWGDFTVTSNVATLDADTVSTSEIATDGVDSDEIAADAVGTAELDDGADTPLAGEWVQVDAADTTQFSYRTDAELLSDTGAITASSTDTLTNKTINTASNTITIVEADISDLAHTVIPVTDTTSIVEGSADATKEIRIEVDGLTTATVRVWTAPDQDLDLTPGTGDFATAAEGDLAATALQNVIEDTTPQLGGDLDGEGNNLADMGVIFLREQAEADADVAGQGQIWIDTATPNELFFTDDAGTDWPVQFKPANVWTVCSAGCDYSDVNTAITAVGAEPAPANNGYKLIQLFAEAYTVTPFTIPANTVLSGVPEGKSTDNLETRNSGTLIFNNQQGSLITMTAVSGISQLAISITRSTTATADVRAIENSGIVTVRDVHISFDTGDYGNFDALGFYANASRFNISNSSVYFRAPTNVTDATGIHVTATGRARAWDTWIGQGSTFSATNERCFHTLGTGSSSELFAFNCGWSNITFDNDVVNAGAGQSLYIRNSPSLDNISGTVTIYDEISATKGGTLPASGDLGDVSIASGSITLDANVVDSAEIVTDAVGTDEIDLTIAPAWTGTHDFANDIVFSERADHSETPAAGKGQLWVRSDTPNVLVFTDDAGSDTVLGAGGGGSLPVTDTTSIAEGSADATKEVRFEVDGLTTATVRVLTMADQNIDLTPGTGSFATEAEGNLAATALQNVVEDTTPNLGGDLDADGNNITDGGVIFLNEQAEADADVAGDGQIWVDTATPNVLMFTDDAGTDFQLNSITDWASLAGASTSWDADGTLTMKAKDYGDERCYWFSFATDTTAPTGSFTIDIPDTWDTAKFPNTSENRLVISTTDITVRSGGTIYLGAAMYGPDNNTINFVVRGATASYVNVGTVTPTVPGTFGSAGDLISGKFCGPIN